MNQLWENAQHIFISGGTGTLGKALLKHLAPKPITVYSRDEIRQNALKALYPNVFFVVGDVADYAGVYRAMRGSDLVIHAAAFKHVPSGERNARALIQSNVAGSENVLQAALELGVKRVIGISTDKAAAPINAYGATKLLMEKSFQAAAAAHPFPHISLVRYGNVLNSTGSVIEVWRKMKADQGFVNATAPDMTRFWLDTNQAIRTIEATAHADSGEIVIPKLRSTSMAHLAKIVLPDTDIRYQGFRAGEKLHETLFTEYEAAFIYRQDEDFFYLSPMFRSGVGLTTTPYTSANAPRFTTAELSELIK